MVETKDGEGEGRRGESPEYFFYRRAVPLQRAAMPRFLTASATTRVRTGMSYGCQGPRWHPGWYVSCSDSGSTPQVRAVTLHGCFIRYSCCLKIKHDFMGGDLNRRAEHSNCEWQVLPHGSTCSSCCVAFMLQKHRSDPSQPEEEDAWVALEQTQPIKQAGGQQADCSLRFKWVWAHTGLQMSLKDSDNLPTAVRLDKSEVATASEDSRRFVPLTGRAPGCQKPQHLLWRVWESVRFICTPACWKKGRRGGGGGFLAERSPLVEPVCLTERRPRCIPSSTTRVTLVPHLQIIFACLAHAELTAHRDSCTATACRRHGGGAQAPGSPIALAASLLSKVKSGQESSCRTTGTTPGSCCFHWARESDGWLLLTVASYLEY